MFKESEPGFNRLARVRTEMERRHMTIKTEEEVAAQTLDASGRLHATGEGLIWVYAPGVCDLFHVGHVEFFRRARALGDRVIVGIPTDENTNSYKPRPIMKLEERVAVVAACRYVDRVIPDAPMVVHAAFLDSIGAAFACHGDDISEAERERVFPGLFATGRFKFIPYTRTVSSREIIERVAQRLREGTLRIRL
jgi:cytidyltransferase-like protein